MTKEGVSIGRAQAGTPDTESETVRWVWQPQAICFWSQKWETAWRYQTGGGWGSCMTHATKGWTVWIILIICKWSSAEGPVHFAPPTPICCQIIQQTASLCVLLLLSETEPSGGFPIFFFSGWLFFFFLKKLDLPQLQIHLCLCSICWQKINKKGFTPISVRPQPGPGRPLLHCRARPPGLLPTLLW